jgi:hypothetical protein
MRRVRYGRRTGATLVLVILGLTCLLGAAALTIDVGRLFLAAERAQSVADAAALAAIPALGDGPATERAVMDMVQANNDSPGGFKVACDGFDAPDGSDLILYGPGSTLPGGTVATSSLSRGLTVTCRIYVPHTFARVFAVEGAVVERQATVIKTAMGGGVVSPMWISATTPVAEGQSQNILMGHTDIPGNFGWLDLPDGADMKWTDVMAGDPLTPATQEAMTVTIGQTLEGLTGLGVGRWDAALEDRIASGSAGMWAGQTWNNCTPDNPRIMLVPMVTYLGESGSNATYRIERFNAFWLESTTTGGDAGSVKEITATFMGYEANGMLAPDLEPPTAVAYRLYN